MNHDKQDFELKVAELVAKNNLTDDEKRFLAARKDYIDPAVYSKLDLSTPKGTKDEPITVTNLDRNEPLRFDFSKLTEDEIKEFAAANNIDVGDATTRDEVKAVVEGAVVNRNLEVESTVTLNKQAKEEAAKAKKAKK